jgi:hypothetical protein
VETPRTSPSPSPDPAAVPGQDDTASPDRPSPYAVPLPAFLAGAHVPATEQVQLHPASPPPEGLTGGGEADGDGD